MYSKPQGIRQRRDQLQANHRKEGIQSKVDVTIYSCSMAVIRPTIVRGTPVRVLAAPVLRGTPELLLLLGPELDLEPPPVEEPEPEPELEPAPELELAPPELEAPEPELELEPELGEEVEVAKPEVPVVVASELEPVVVSVDSESELLVVVVVVVESFLVVLELDSEPVSPLSFSLNLML